MSSIETRTVSEAIDRDAAAVIALWLAIYGGDPPPHEVEVSPAAGLIAAALVTQLTAELGSPGEPMSDVELDARLSRLGLRLGYGHEHVDDEVTRITGGFTCFKGPEGEPGCCIRLAYHVSGGGLPGTDNP